MEHTKDLQLHNIEIQKVSIPLPTTKLYDFSFGCQTSALSLLHQNLQAIRPSGLVKQFEGLGEVS